MKSLLILSLISLLLWSSCTNNTEEPALDCTQSGLVVSVVSVSASDCATPGSITVSATGGSGTYLYSVDGSNFQSSTLLDDLTAGTYTVTVKDSDGCTHSINATVEAEAGSLTMELNAQDAGCGTSDGSITATVTGGTPPYMYSLDGGTSQTSNVFSDIAVGMYEVTVEDAASCEATRNATIGSGISLASDIMPIISSNCAVTGCHNGTRVPDLRTSAGIISNASRIKARTVARTMPPADRQELSQANIDKIVCWVDSGAPDN